MTDQDYFLISKAAALDAWLFAEQIGELEGVKPRRARKKYNERAQMSGAPDSVTRLVPSNGGLKLQFSLSLLDEATQRKYRAATSASAPAPEKLASPESTMALQSVSSPGGNIVAREALAQLLPLEGIGAQPEISAIP